MMGVMVSPQVQGQGVDLSAEFWLPCLEFVEFVPAFSLGNSAQLLGNSFVRKLLKVLT